jgi:opacity protein-like surface antigen
MSQKKTLSLFTVAIMLTASLISAPKAKADGLAPGEGAYLGAFIGYGMGVIQADVNSFAQTEDSPYRRNRAANSYEIDRGGLGLEGIQGGLWAGYGIKTADDIYFGGEITAAAADEKIELKTSDGIKSSSDDTDTFADITSISATRKWTAGAAARLGYYINADTLIAAKAGIAVSEFDVDIGSSSESYYAGGPQFGGTIDSRISKIDPNLSIRMEFLVTNYLTADVLAKNGQATRTTGGTGYDAELTGIDTAGRIGLTYNFNAF